MRDLTRPDESVRIAQGGRGGVGNGYAEDATTGTATSVDDYDAVGTVLVTFTAGAGNGDTQSFFVVIVDDPDAEADETVDLELSNASPGALVGLGVETMHTVTIQSDE